MRTRAYLDLRQQSNVVDFGATRTQLTTLSNTLASQATNGAIVFQYGGVYLTGDNTSDTQVFNVNASQLSNLDLQNVKSTALVVINVTGGSSFDTVSLSGGQTGQFEELRERIIDNFTDATHVNVGTYVYGSILANNADVTGFGHLEGSLIATSLSTRLEIGYQPAIVTAVPEPETYAMMFAGLALLGFMQRRKAKPAA
jgi:choice-of-anchor A domain-containing protein